MRMSGTGIGLERGFTLLELMVVIALLGLLLAAGAQALPTSRTSLGRQADRIEHALYQARRQARESGQAVSLACAKLLGTPDGAHVGEEYRASCRDGHMVTDTLVFYPDSSIRGDSIEVRAGEGRIRLSVDWLSGDVSRD